MTSKTLSDLSDAPAMMQIRRVHAGTTNNLTLPLF